MIYLNSDTCFTWSGMTSSLTDDYVNDADVNGSLLDTSGNVLATFDLIYVTDSNGDYEGCLTADQTSDLEECGNYVVEIVATSGSSTERRRENQTAVYRGYT